MGVCAVSADVGRTGVDGECEEAAPVDADVCSYPESDDAAIVLAANVS